MERETTTTEIQGHTFTHYTYTTARETNNIQKAYFEGAKVEIVGDAPKISDFDPSVQFNVQLAMIKELVVEMDGSKENIVKRCEDLPDEVFQELSTTLDLMVSKKKK